MNLGISLSITSVCLAVPVPPPELPPDGDDLMRYEHQQTQASTTWTINHELGRWPSVTLRTVGGVEFDGQVQHVTTNQCVVHLETPMVGSAVCLG